jgi:hypothetical protein
MGPKEHNTWKKDNMRRALIAVRSKEMEICELPTYLKCRNQLLKIKLSAQNQVLKKCV